MPIEPWERNRRRFGLKLGPLPSDPRKMATGLAVFETLPPLVSTAGIAFGDPIETAIATYRTQAALHPGCSGVKLYRYRTDESFAGSRAAAESMSRKAHWEMIDKIADRLRQEGIDVEIETI